MPQVGVLTIKLFLHCLCCWFLIQLFIFCIEVFYTLLIVWFLSVSFKLVDWPKGKFNPCLYCKVVLCSISVVIYRWFILHQCIIWPFYSNMSLWCASFLWNHKWEFTLYRIHQLDTACGVGSLEISVWHHWAWKFQDSRHHTVECFPMLEDCWHNSEVHKKKKNISKRNAMQVLY